MVVIKDVPIEAATKALNAFQMFREWKEQTKIEIISKYQELRLVSERYQFGGTLDAIGKLNAELITLRDVTALLNALGGGTTTGGGGNSMADKLDELIGLLKSGAIGVNIDGSKATALLYRAQRDRGAFGAI